MPEELSYSDLLAERDTYKAEIDALKQDRVNRQAKNSVFLNLFTRKEYQLQLYKCCSRLTQQSRKPIWK